jgi:hypothetical protein
MVQYKAKSRRDTDKNRSSISALRQGEGKAPRASHLLCASSPCGRIPYKHDKSRNKDWINLLKRNLETNSFILQDAVGHTKAASKARS